MKRMIDAINGLAITTEIMLVELARSLDAAEKEASRPFTSGEEFWGWFELRYGDQMKPVERARWVHDPIWNAILMFSSDGPPKAGWRIFDMEGSKVCHVKPCKAEFAKLIREKGLLERHGDENGQNFCIARLLLKALGYRIRDKVDIRSLVDVMERNTDESSFIKAERSRSDK